MRAGLHCVAEPNYIAKTQFLVFDISWYGLSSYGGSVESIHFFTVTCDLWSSYMGWNQSISQHLQTVRNENPVPAMRYQVQRSCRELSLKDLKPRGHLDSSKWVPPPQWNLYLYSPIQHQSTYRLIFIINPTFVNRTYSHVWWWNPDFQNYQSPILSCLNPHVLYHISYLIIVKHPIHILNNSPFFIQSFILGIYTFILYIYICIYWLPILYLSLRAPFLFTMNFSSRQGSARICPCAKRKMWTWHRHGPGAQWRGSLHKIAWLNTVYINY